MLKRSNSEIIDIFKEELKSVEERIKSEIYSTISKELSNIKNVLSAIISEVNNIKNEMKDMQKLAISSAVEGLAKINIKQFTEDIKTDIINFLRTNKFEVELDGIVNSILSTISDISKDVNTKYLTIQNNIESIQKRLDELESKLSSLEEKLENIKIKEINVDTSDIKNEIDVLRSILRDVVGKIEYIYEFNKKLEERIKQKEKVEGEEE